MQPGESRVCAGAISSEPEKKCAWRADGFAPVRSTGEKNSRCLRASVRVRGKIVFVFLIDKAKMKLAIDPSRKEYDFSRMAGKKNPHVNRLKKQVTIRWGIEAIEYFKEMSEVTGIPYQNLINSYLSDCARNQRKLVVNRS
jgi:predicted DNA binding CopG/RHH family protein